MSQMSNTPHLSVCQRKIGGYLPINIWSLPARWEDVKWLAPIASTMIWVIWLTVVSSWRLVEHTWRGVNLLNAGRVRVYYQISILISDIIYVLIICNFFWPYFLIFSPFFQQFSTFFSVLPKPFFPFFWIFFWVDTLHLSLLASSKLGAGLLPPHTLVSQLPANRQQVVSHSTVHTLVAQLQQDGSLFVINPMPFDRQPLRERWWIMRPTQLFTSQQTR